jgi:hypothetical protein
MNSLIRTFLPAVPLAALTVLAAGCHSAPTAAPSAVTSAVTSAMPSPSASATVSQALAAPSRSVSGPAQAAPSSAVAVASTAVTSPGVTSPAAAPAATVYLAEGATTTGKMLHAPACPAGCELSGDGTASLWNMTWSAWNASEAVGTGTEKLDDCMPNCAAGTLHAVPVRVVLSGPVKACAGGKGTWIWTRASFTWPSGLPAVFAGGNAPSNPFIYYGITAGDGTAC